MNVIPLTHTIVYHNVMDMSSVLGHVVAQGCSWGVTFWCGSVIGVLRFFGGNVT
jgi:hypothetical protein